MAQFLGQLFVLSTDVINDDVRGDLTRAEAMQLWARLLRAGCVAAVPAGPPCETWPIACFRPPIPRADGGVARHPPRPL
eukprot:8128584-Pyramimonas_sp.AAC.1